MTTPTVVKGQMKGLLKGLRYISQIFDEEEEKEIKIGFPTDVKHLAHIGCDDAKASTPSWMTDFKGSQEPSSGAEANSTQTPPEGNNENNKSEAKRRKSRLRSSSESQATEGSTEGSTKPSRRHHSSETSRKSRPLTEEEKPPTTSKHSHRRKSKTATSSEEKDGSTRRASRTRRASKGGESMTDIPFTDSGPSSQ